MCKTLAFAGLALVVLAGCTAESAPAPATTSGASIVEPSPMATPTTTAEATPTTTPWGTLGSEWSTGTMALAGCRPVSDAFKAAVMNNVDGSQILKAEVGAVVTSPTGPWAVIGITFDGIDGTQTYVYITQDPPTPPTSAKDTNLEIINVGRAALPQRDPGYTPGEPVLSNFALNTKWRGDLLALGEEAAVVAIRCVEGGD